MEATKPNGDNVINDPTRSNHAKTVGSLLLIPVLVVTTRILRGFTWTLRKILGDRR